MITRWSEDRTGKVFSKKHTILDLTVALILPPDWLPGSTREARTELYLQAETIVETLTVNGYQFAEPPVITLGSDGFAVTGFMVLLIEVN